MQKQIPKYTSPTIFRMVSVSALMMGKTSGMESHCSGYQLLDSDYGHLFIFKGPSLGIEECPRHNSYLLTARESITEQAKRIDVSFSPPRVI